MPAKIRILFPGAHTCAREDRGNSAAFAPGFICKICQQLHIFVTNQTSRKLKGGALISWSWVGGKYASLFGGVGRLQAGHDQEVYSNSPTERCFGCFRAARSYNHTQGPHGPRCTAPGTPPSLAVDLLLLLLLLHAHAHAHTPSTTLLMPNTLL